MALPDILLVLMVSMWPPMLMFWSVSVLLFEIVHPRLQTKLIWSHFAELKSKHLTLNDCFQPFACVRLYQKSTVWGKFWPPCQLKAVSAETSAPRECKFIWGKCSSIWFSCYRARMILQSSDKQGRIIAAEPKSRNSRQPLYLHVFYLLYMDKQILALESVCSIWTYTFEAKQETKTG